MNNFKERAQAEINRINSEKIQAESEEQTRRASELRDRRLKATELLGQIGSLDIRRLLEEMNRDVWNQRGHVTKTEERDSPDPDGIVFQTQYDLASDVPGVKPVITPIYVEVFGAHTEIENWTDDDGSGTSNYTHTGWHYEKVGERVDGHSVSTTPHKLTLGYYARTDRNECCVYFEDPQFRFPDFRHPKVINSSSFQPNGQNGAYAYNREQWKKGIGLVFFNQDRPTFDLDLVRSFIDHGLLSDAIERTRNPIEPHFQKAEAQAARIEKLRGTVIRNSVDFIDPTPRWQRLRNPMKEISGNAFSDPMYASFSLTRSLF